MQIIEDELEYSIEQRARCNRIKAELQHKLASHDARLRVIQPEFDRLCVFRGKYVDSDVVHGKAQRFDTGSLRKQLEMEISVKMREVAKAKNKIRELEIEANHMKELHMKREADLKDRQAAYRRFNKEIETKRAAKKMLGSFHRDHDLKKIMIKRWKAYVIERRAEHAMVDKVLRRLIYNKVGSAWEKWWHEVEEYRRLVSDEATIEGAGSRALVRAKKLRSGLLNEFDATLRMVANSKSEIKRASRTSQQQRTMRQNVLYEKNKNVVEVTEQPEEPGVVLNLNKGDALMDLGYYERALRAYEEHVVAIQERQDPKELFVAYSRMGFA